MFQDGSTKSLKEIGMITGKVAMGLIAFQTFFQFGNPTGE